MKLSTFTQPQPQPDLATDITSAAAEQLEPAAVPSTVTTIKRLKIGALAFNKHIADELNSRLRTGSKQLIPGSPEQEAIWQFLLHGTSHGIIQACAGTGKTFTIIQGILRLQQAYGADVTAVTYNSFGWRSCLKAYRNIELDEYKTGRIVEQLVEDRCGRDNLGYNGWWTVLTATRKLVELCMNYLLDGTDTDALDELADRHNLEYGSYGRQIVQLVPAVLAACAEDTTCMSYTDQVWQPVYKKLPVDTFDLLFVDESQDTSKVQQELALMACPTGRIVFCGDENQAIYGFRGADTDSIPRMKQHLGSTSRGVEVFPLTVTRRCPVSHVRLAQAIVPHIQAMPDAPDGSIVCQAPEDAARNMKVGDLVLCRTNAPLVSVAYSLIKRNVKAVIRGRDIGTNLRQLVDRLKAGDSIHNLLSKLTDYRQKELLKLSRLGDKAASKVQSLTDRCDCVVALTDGINSVTALKQKIDRIFADFEADGTPKDAVVLGSVHRTKGLEAGTVYVLRPDLLPHSMAKQPWERRQELNLAYVAVTRAKYDAKLNQPGKLVFVGLEVPPIYRQGELQTNGTDTHD